MAYIKNVSNIKKKLHRKETGFTLMELLTTMAILIILMGLVIGSLIKVRSYTFNTDCQKNLRNLHNVSALYFLDYRNLPPATTAIDIIADKEKDELNCPVLKRVNLHYYASVKAINDINTKREFINFLPDTPLYSDIPYNVGSEEFIGKVPHGAKGNVIMTSGKLKTQDA